MTDLSVKQSEAVNHDEGALLVTAGPGSGKTRVLTERIRRLLSKTDENFHVLALTYSNKAANEMRERLSSIRNIEERSFIGTIHSFCIEVLKSKGVHIGIKEPFSILQNSDDKRFFILEAVKNDLVISNEFNVLDKREVERKINYFANKISYYKKYLIIPESLEEGIEKQIYKAYNTELLNSHMMDFDDLIYYSYQLFINFPKIANLYRKQYKYILIDEAQDLSSAHYAFLKSLCGEEFTNVMMVGDKNQSIYGFNGSSPKYMFEFLKDFHAKKIELVENFRSSKAVVAAARSIFPDYKVEGKLPIKGAIKILRGNNEEDESIKVFNYFQNLLEQNSEYIEGKLSWSRCAILARNRYVFTQIKELLRKNNVPFYERTSSIYQSESELMKEFESCLHLLANPNDIIHLEFLKKNWIGTELSEIIKNAKDGNELLSKAIEIEISSQTNIVISAIKKVIPVKRHFDLIEALDSLKNNNEKIYGDNERENFLRDLEHWIDNWTNFIRKHSPEQYNINSFITSVALGETNISTPEGLALLTLHSSKGLEFDVVSIMGMVEGIIPDYRADSKEKFDEEKRNIFVAITRSKRLLLFSYPEKRNMPWGSTVSTIPSQFLEDIRKNIQEFQE